MCNQNGIKEQLKYEIMKISQILIKQNYFQFQGTLYIQEEGLAMDAPTSSIFSHVYLQHKLAAIRYLTDTMVTYNLYVNNKVRGRADKFCLHLDRKWTGKDILMK